MSSLRRIQSSRANGAKSRGPKSDVGLQAASLNATTHGLTAQTVVLAAESTGQFEASLQNYIAHFQPHTQTALDLVHQLAAVAWRIARFTGIESRILDEHLDRQASYSENRKRTAPELIALAFEHLANGGPTLSLLNRYQARLQREYQRTLAALEQLRKASSAEKQKLQNEPNPANEHTPAPAGILQIDQPFRVAAAECQPIFSDSAAGADQASHSALTHRHNLSSEQASRDG